jgi:hypothetical protein
LFVVVVVDVVVIHDWVRGCVVIVVRGHVQNKRDNERKLIEIMRNRLRKDFFINKIQWGNK